MDAGLSLAARNHWVVVCRDAQGRERWREAFWNLIPTEGLNYVLETAFRSGAAIGTWRLGLISASPAPSLQSTDTAAQIGGANGWTELGTRQTMTLAAASGGAIAAATASFAIGSSGSVRGAFMVSSASGASGTLYGEGLFAADQPVNSGDTVEVAVTLSLVSSA